MRYEEFVGRVRERAGLGSFKEAERATRATVGQLGKYLSGGEDRLDIASQLPDELAEHVRFQEPKEQTPPYDEFLRRLGQGEGASAEEAEAHARVVVSVLREVIGEGDMEKVRRQFPGEFATLFADAG